MISYAHYPYSQIPESVSYLEDAINLHVTHKLKEYDCQAGQESFFGPHSRRHHVYQQGESLH